MKTVRRRGSALLIVMIVLMVTFTMGSAFLSLATSSFHRGRNDVLRAQALNLAEAGIDRAIYSLRLDGNPAPLNGLTQTFSGIGNYVLSVGTGTGDNTDKFVVESIGTATLNGKTIKRKLRTVIYRKTEDLSVWNNVVFGGVGASGRSINGNVVMRGSIHLLGEGEEYTDVDGDGKFDDWEFKDNNGNGVYDPGVDELIGDLDGDGRIEAQEPFTDVNGNGVREAPLTVTEQAGDLSGSANMGNNYDGMDSGMKAKTRPLDQRRFGGEDVEYLDAKLRVKHGRIDISGTATVGKANVAGGSPAIKETMEGVYVSDGFGGNAGTSSVYSDNGTNEKYDLNDLPEEKKVRFPTLSDAVTVGGVDFASHEAYLETIGYTYTGDLVITSGTSGEVGSVAQGNYLRWYEDGRIEISGVIRVVGNIRFDQTGSNPNFSYTGWGSLYATGDTSDKGHITINATILSAGKFPRVQNPEEGVEGGGDTMGFIARRNLNIEGAQRQLAGAFYAQQTVTSTKQSHVLGTFVASYFDMGQNVPHIYQVPMLAKNLPPGMPGDRNISLVRTNVNSWRDLNPQ